MGGCQKYGPFLGPYDNTTPNIWGTQQRTMILSSLKGASASVAIVMAVMMESPKSVLRKFPCKDFGQKGLGVIQGIYGRCSLAM